MKSVRIAKDELLQTVQKNRENHRTIFLEAQEGYKKAIIAKLEEMLKAARQGKRVSEYLNLAAPIDQTKEYDHVIRMLEMSQDDVVELTQQDFAQYVMDDWHWKGQFLHSNSVYSATASGMLEDYEND